MRPASAKDDKVQGQGATPSKDMKDDATQSPTKKRLVKLRGKAGGLSAFTSVSREGSEDHNQETPGTTPGIPRCTVL